MKILAAAYLILCAALFLGVTISGHRQLPERIASNFDSSGTAKGWSDRDSFTLTTAATGIGVPALVTAMVFAMRIFPARFLNAPNAAHWRKPENYRRACEFLFYSSLVFGGTFLLWQSILYHLVVSANKTSPPHLNSALTALSTIPLLAFIIGWMAALIFRFQRTDEDAGSDPAPRRPSRH
jgi:hypothetical protein